jgi:hypothetical protein
MAGARGVNALTPHPPLSINNLILAIGGKDDRSGSPLSLLTIRILLPPSMVIAALLSILHHLPLCHFCVGIGVGVGVGIGVGNGIPAPTGQQHTQAGDSPGVVGLPAVKQQGIVGVALAERQWCVAAVGRESSRSRGGCAMALLGW